MKPIYPFLILLQSVLCTMACKNTSSSAPQTPSFTPTIPESSIPKIATLPQTIPISTAADSPELIFKMPETIFIKGGTFQMGSNEWDAYDIEKPTHTVRVSDFYIGKYEVTFEEYDYFCEATKRAKPSDEGWGRARHPVINVSWEDATTYCKWLSLKTNKKYRLPTEAEWEYAARGGHPKHRYAGTNDDEQDEIDLVAWTARNSGNETHPVGAKRANEFGVYDMTGNVWECCADWYGAYSSASQDNPIGATTGTFRVIRSGSWSARQRFCRVSNRSRISPTNRDGNVGFRVVCESAAK
jgi:formylglycine-generating enzyme required for sulfatase activity